ncbi:Ig-like domain-containing protein [Citrobacter portucalensis]|uniref:Ig-like domain-containing protein n=1 Tax=Citrobacter portucalensis TaxID=1639133 RepID=UPI00226BADF1|nr:Ig-like domain-containing protein [Citrobacter portucalensis]MCX9059152.1 Ig-like domain-containing protein [Citrobacter portucalensis]
MATTDAKITLNNIALSDVKEIKVADTDLVITLRSGKRAVIKDGALRSMIDSQFKIQFTDKEIEGASLLRMAGKMEVSELSDVAVASAEQSNEDVLVSDSGAATDSASSAVSDSVGGAATTAAPPEGVFATILKWAPTATIVGAVGAVAGIFMGGGGGGGGGGSTTVIPPTVAPVASKLDLTSASSDGVNAAESASTDGVVSVIAASGTTMSLSFVGPNGIVTREVAGLGADNPVLVTLTAEELAQLGQGNIAVTGTTASGQVLPKVNFLLDTIAPDAAEATLDVKSDSGVKNDDLITAKNALSFNVKGELGATVKIYNDSNNNNQLDEGELIGQTTLNGSTQGTVDVAYLAQGQYSNLKVLQEDKIGNQSASTKLADIHIDNTVPNAQLALKSESDSGNNTDNITYNTTVTVTVNGEKGGQAVIFNDLNNNNILDVGEELAQFTMIGDTQDVSVNLRANDTNRLQVIVTDIAGNKQESTQPLTVIVDSSPPVFMEKTALLLSSGSSIDAMDNNTLINSSRATETLTTNHFGLASDLPKNILVTFTNLTNALIYKDGSLINSVTLEDIMLGKVTIAYTQADANQQGVFARVDYTITQPSVRSEAEFKITDSLAFKSSNNAMVIWADGSGNGGSSSKWTSGGAGGGENGGGSDDNVVGSAQSDLIFGDGSGGGQGRHPYNNSGGPGLGGSGNDFIDAGDGDDIIFGDGYSASSTPGGYGGGGGGGVYGSNSGGSGGVGAGGGVNNYGGSQTSLGPSHSSGANSGGWGGLC